MLKRFAAYYKPHLLMFSLDMAASLTVSLIGMLYPIMTRTMLNDLIPNRQYKMIVVIGLALLCVYAIRMALQYFIQYQGHVVGVKMQAHMRTDLFRKLESLPYSYYDNNETGKIMSRMTNDLFEISELAHHGPENLFICSVMVVGSFCYLCTIDWVLTLVIFACVPILVSVSLILRKKMRDAFMESRKSIAEINSALESSISGIRVTKAFTNFDTESKKFERGNQMYVEARRKSYRYMAQFHSSTAFVTDIFNVIVLIAGGLFLYGGRITFGDYSTFVVSINLFIGPVMTLIGFVEQYQNGVTGFARFLEVMDEEPEFEKPDAKPMEKVEGNIVFDHVSFAYDESKEVVHDITLDIGKGQKLALVGPSGGGKTTLCHLIPRFYNYDEGKLTIDGVDINDITLESLRRNIGIVQQDVFLFDGTIGENILYGRPDATYEEMVEAAKRANIDEYVATLPDGYDTQIGERGVKLSGGQKQRLSIARVFLKDPAILILDEATSALDNTTEILIQEALDELCKGRTTLVVAHRLSTVRNADRIVVVSRGKIIEEGTHDALITENGVYAKLYSLQFREGESNLGIE
ncbi:MAG: ABC transporter ATP-binding protein [Ruminococcaceae bacterium]|nr:ABC transporter ATP-binding protein [Oscillospiraceae bacterium]